MKDFLFVLTGSVAVNKAILLIRKLIRDGYTCSVICTKSAYKLITEDVSDLELIDNEFKGDFRHIDLAKQHRAMVVCPATANAISAMSHGVSLDLWMATFLMFEPSSVFVFPAMNPSMWLHPAVIANVENVKSMGINVCGVGSGECACGDEGEGRMLEVDEIYTVLTDINKFRGRNILITGGPTREYMDTVRFLTNDSSGETALAVAKYYSLRGAKVTLLTSLDVILSNVVVVNVISAADLLREVQNRLKDEDVYVSLAAVSDFRFAEISDEKLVRSDFDSNFKIELKKTPDILEYVCSNKRNCRVVVFSLFDSGLNEKQISEVLVKKARDGVDLLIGNPRSNIGKTGGEVSRYYILRGGKLVTFDMAKNSLGGLIAEELY